jgi:hypothetical protein
LILLHLGFGGVIAYCFFGVQFSCHLALQRQQWYVSAPPCFSPLFLVFALLYFLPFSFVHKSLN